VPYLIRHIEADTLYQQFSFATVAVRCAGYTISCVKVSKIISLICTIRVFEA